MAEFKYLQKIGPKVRVLFQGWVLFLKATVISKASQSLYLAIAKMVALPLYLYLSYVEAKNAMQNLLRDFCGCCKRKSSVVIKSAVWVHMMCCSAANQ